MCSCLHLQWRFCEYSRSEAALPWECFPDAEHARWVVMVVVVVVVVVVVAVMLMIVVAIVVVVVVLKCQ